jgi:uncharacterized protein YehS (DUF1456 family)
MNNNDVLRQLRYALRMTDAQMVALLAQAGQDMSEENARSMLGKEGEEGTVICLDSLMADFLDSLILLKRGPPKGGSPVPQVSVLTNNIILKKIRIALKLHEEDMLSILSAGGQPMSKSEITALFRKPNHKHYRECGDQLLRAFFRGLTMRLRPS